jgi:4-hydroxy-2-oxoheptanedioate aldolase
MRGLGKTKIAKNPVKYNLHHGLPAVGTWVSSCSPQVAESIAGMGWDWVVVDAQHSPVSWDNMVNCFRGIQLAGAAPMARVPWLDTVWIQRTLDAGALGLVVPMVNTAEDAKRVVSNFRYGPYGQRSSGGSRVAQYVDNYGDWANNNLAVIVMIETVEAVENAEAILSVEGVDGCFIGPNDLMLSMGLRPDQIGPGTAHEQAMLHVLEMGRKVGTATGKHCWSPEEVNMRIQQGFQFLALKSDVGFMLQAATAEYNKLNIPLKATGALDDEP